MSIIIVGRQRPGRARRELPHLREPAVPRSVRGRAEIIRQVVDHGVHEAVLAPDLLRRGAVPVQLEVVVVAVDRAGLRGAGSCSSGRRRRCPVVFGIGKSFMTFSEVWLIRFSGDLVVGERLAADAVRAAVNGL